MASCVSSLLKGVQSSCNATKKVGGLDRRIYLGGIDDLATVTFLNNGIATMTFKPGKGLVKYIGRTERNSAGSDVEPGDNVNIRRQSVNMAVYYETAEDLENIDSLIDQERVFGIVETVPGSLEVFGINKSNFSAFGLRVSANPGSSGIVLNDSTAFAMVLSGGFTNLQLLYKPAVALATNIAELDSMTVDPPGGGSE